MELRRFIDRSKLYFLDAMGRGKAISNTPLNGQYKWLGGIHHNDKIYGVPHNANGVFILDVLDESVEVKDYGLDMSGEMKWWDAVIDANGIIYCIPFKHDKFLVIDTNNETASFQDFGLDLSTDFSYAGGTIDDNGIIYCCPYNEVEVLTIDTTTSTASKSKFGYLFQETSQYTDAVYINGHVYMIPYWADHFFVIDVATGNSYREKFDIPLLSKLNNFSRGTIVGDNIVIPPFNNTRIATINTTLDDRGRGRVNTTNINTVNKFSKMVRKGSGYWMIPHGSLFCFYISDDFLSTGRTDYVMDKFIALLIKYTSYASFDKFDYPYKNQISNYIDNDSTLDADDKDKLKSLNDKIPDFIYGLEQIEDSWSDAFLASNGKIYGVPYNARSVLIID